MKKMIVLTSLWSFLFIFSFQCSVAARMTMNLEQRPKEEMKSVLPCGGDQWKSSGHLD